MVVTYIDTVGLKLFLKNLARVSVSNVYLYSAKSVMLMFSETDFFQTLHKDNLHQNSHLHRGFDDLDGISRSWQHQTDEMAKQHFLKVLV